MTVATAFVPGSVGACLAGGQGVRNRSAHRTAGTVEAEDPFGPAVLHDAMQPAGAVFVGTTPYVCTDVADIYTTYTGKVTSCFATLAEAMELGRQFDEPRFFLIDIDSFSLSEVIGQLIYFRVWNPKHVVILLSHDFAHDDFSTSRKAVADASLKLPLSRMRLLRGLGFARRNNLFTMG